MLAKQAGFETRYVTANSGADRLRLLLGGTADIALFAASEYVAQGEGLRALVYFGPERLPNLPDVPTAVESGVDLTISVFREWLAPAGLDPAVEAKLQEVLQAVLADEDVIAELTDLSIDPAWIPADEIAARLDEMNARTAPLVEKARAMAN